MLRELRSRRTTNDNAAAYFERLTSAGHGSVLEHASFSFLLYGISRSVTHELVRHRAGAGFSQISRRRYVSGATCDRFVERPDVSGGSGAWHRLYRGAGRLTGLETLRPTYFRRWLRVNCWTRGRSPRSQRCSGVKPVYKVELEDGKYITCSRKKVIVSETEAPDGFHRNVGGLELSHNRDRGPTPSLESEIMVLGVAAYRDSSSGLHQYIERDPLRRLKSDSRRLPANGTIQK